MTGPAYQHMGRCGRVRRASRWVNACVDGRCGARTGRDQTGPDRARQGQPQPQQEPSLQLRKPQKLRRHRIGRAVVLNRNRDVATCERVGDGLFQQSLADKGSLPCVIHSMRIARPRTPHRSTAYVRLSGRPCAEKPQQEWRAWSCTPPEEETRTQNTHTRMHTHTHTTTTTTTPTEAGKAATDRRFLRRFSRQFVPLQQFALVANGKEGVEQGVDEGDGEREAQGEEHIVALAPHS